MLLIYGKNGAGKTYVANQLLGCGFSKIVSYTTRDKRTGEVDGLDYHFVSRKIFEDLLAKGFFVEYKKLNENYYGTPCQSFSDKSISISGKIEDLKKNYSGDIDIFYMDTTLEKRYHRVKSRSITNQELFSRFNSENFDFLFDFQGHFIDNNRSDTSALHEILSITSDPSPLMHNVDFIKEQLGKKLTLSKDDQMLAFLQYEEQLLRQMFISGMLKQEQFSDYYLQSLMRFTKSNGIQMDILSANELLLNLNGENFISNLEENKKILVKRS